MSTFLRISARAAYLKRRLAVVELRYSSGIFDITKTPFLRYFSVI